MDTKKTLIIIVNYNGLVFLKKCITTLKLTKNTSFDICIVDNASSDDSIKWIEKQPYYYIKNKKNLGFAKANNQAIIKYPRYDYYLLLNNDTEIIDPDWFNTLIKKIEKDKTIGIIGPKLLNKDKTLQESAGNLKIISAKMCNENKETEVDWVCGAAILIKKEVIKKIGLLDEIYSPAYYEETDFCLRAKKAGFKVIYNPKSKVIHFGGQTTKNNQDKMYWVKQKNKLKFILLNYSTFSIFLRTPWEIGFALKSIINKKDKEYLEMIKTLWSQKDVILRKRRQRQ